MSEAEGVGVDLKIELRQESNWWWKWEVRRRNTRRNQWSREDWLPTSSGHCFTESGAKQAAKRAVREFRFLETREPIVYYDPPKPR